MSKRDQMPLGFKWNDVNWPLMVLLAGIILGMAVLGHRNFLLFHFAAELFIAIVAFLMFLVAWHTYPFSKNAFLMYLGGGYFWVGALEIIHAMHYKGMQLLSTAGSNHATQYWIAARFIEVILLATGPIFLSRPVSRYFGFILFGILALLLHLSIHLDLFPDAYVEGHGLTAFKSYTEYAFIGLLSIAWIELYKQRARLGKGVLFEMSAALAFGIASEFMFTLYTDVYGVSNFIGHIFKILSFSFILRAIVGRTLQAPYLSMEQLLRDRSRELAIANQSLAVDSAKRKAVESALEASRHRTHLAASTSGAAVWEWDLQENSVSWDPRMFELHGMLPGDIPLNAKQWARHVHPQDKSKFWGALRNALRQGANLTTDLRYVLPSGAVRHFRVNAVFLKDHNAQAIRLIGIMQDITQQQRSQLILQARIDLVEYSAGRSPEELMVETLDKAELITDSQIGFFHTFESDKNSIRLVAWSSNTTATMCQADSASRHYPLDAAGVWADCVRQRRPIIYNDYEALPHRKGMPPGHALVRRMLAIPLIRQDEIVAIMGVGNKHGDYDADDVGNVERLADLAWDIAERKWTELRLQESEARWQYALDGAGEGVWDRNLQAGTIYYSRQWKAMLGYEPHEIGDSPDEWESRLHPEDKDQVLEAFHSHLTGQTQEYNSEYRIRSKDGRYRWVLTRGKIIERDEDGNPARMIGTTIDITDRRELEQQLQTAQKLETVGRVAGGIAHDINNLITPIMGYASLLKRQMQAGSTEHEFLEIISRSSLRARDIVSQILNFSRNVEHNPVRLRLEEAVRETVAMLRQSVSPSTEIEVRISDSTLTVDADPDEVHQLLMNLGVNASRAITHKNGVITIEIAPEHLVNRTLRFGPALSGDYARISMSDNGVGMDEDTLSKIFEPFFTTRPAGKGTGLGLSIVYGIVERHHGGIAVSSSPGGGTRFDIFLPAARPAEIAHIAAGNVGAPARPATVLVVDDEPEIVRLYNVVLTAAGYEVVAVSNSPEALRLYEQDPHRFDLVIADLTMPELNGKDLAMKIHQLRGSARIILSTGRSEFLNSDARHEAAISQTLRKPFTPDELERVVTGVLQGAFKPHS